MARILGIDLGTTNSSVAVMEKNGPIVVPNSLGERITPSQAKAPLHSAIACLATYCGVDRFSGRF